MADASAPAANPALSQLNFLVGEWRTELSNAEFLPDRSETLRGHTSFRWVDDGAFLAMRQSETPFGPPQAVWIIGRDQVQGKYEVLYFDRRPMAPGFWQRFECTGFRGQTHGSTLDTCGTERTKTSPGC